MDLFSFVKNHAERIAGATNLFIADVRKLSGASRAIAFGVLCIAVVRGIGAALIFQSVGNLVNAAIGARGVGVVTDDLQSAWWIMLVYLLLAFTSTMMIRRLSGLSFSLVQRIVEMLQPISLLVVAWPMLNSSLSVILLFLAVRWFVQNHIIVALLSSAICIATLLSAHDILVFTATRTMTVGTMLAVAGASLYFGCSVAMAPYREKIFS
ncbi:MAG: hypothetical protein UY72_C0015G0008 [Candidatus Uhrbacteria bacterium GW2011_GWD2_52_7]|uniref:Uncharacterized protein n=1 Tax=Candidatus Uhrbacteria bacterium GW2011_GWD2_52_7 TaxID=1618989 RepID=A0A0G1XH74_9BACT|nr:MAG: hypothetical protein UY72_C0015G0008 [Candidatus Uhrbacteria bacterium GW2011_GWD2_52_7]